MDMGRPSITTDNTINVDEEINVGNGGLSPNL